MEKIIGYQVIIDVDGFHDAKRWIYDAIRARVVKCGQCDQPATNVWWNDAAEWYCRCEAHREYGDQWSGSTRWNPIRFSLNILRAEAIAWKKTLPEDERAKIRIIKYDATDYYELMTDDWNDRQYHYFVGSATEYGRRVFAKIFPLTNGEFVYELHNDYMHEHGGHCHGYGVRGVWETEALAIEAARAEAVKRNMLPTETNEDN